MNSQGYAVNSLSMVHLSSSGYQRGFHFMEEETTQEDLFGVGTYTSSSQLILHQIKQSSNTPSKRFAGCEERIARIGETVSEMYYETEFVIARFLHCREVSLKVILHLSSQSCSYCLDSEYSCSFSLKAYRIHRSMGVVIASLGLFYEII